MSPQPAGEIDGLAAQIRGKDDWIGILRARRAGMQAVIIGRDLRSAFDGVWVNFRRGRTADALAISRAAAFQDPALFIREARRHGLFRSSKVAFHSEPVAHIVKMLLEHEGVFGWSGDEALYLQSVLNLLGLAPFARSTRQAVIAELTKRRAVVVKSCMVCVDRAFRPSIDHLPNEEEQIAEATGQPGYFHREQKAAGFSTIVALMQEIVGWPKTATVLIDEEGIRDGTFERLLMEAARLGEFMEAEVQLDAYPYRADLYLHRVGREAFVRDEYIGDMPLLPGMTVMDMVKVQRFFAFTATVFGSGCKSGTCAFMM